jgi:hypothetical protein
MKNKKGYEYELCIAHIDKDEGAIKIHHINLSLNSGFISTKGTSFCDLGFCNIRVKRMFKPETAKMHVAGL